MSQDDGSLEAQFVVRRPSHTTTVDLVATPGEVIGLIGPNGAGKSTTLRALAGLVAVDEGVIRVGGVTWSSPDVHLPPHERSVGVVFQDHLLFPHLTAVDNVAFGPRSSGVPRKEARTRGMSWLERLAISDLADRHPRELSGGQAQRVAIARALASEPRMLLLDEPTASLDASGAMALRSQLREHLRAFDGVSIVVTHTALDAMVMTDRLVVLDEGAIVQTGHRARSPPGRVPTTSRHWWDSTWSVAMRLKASIALDDAAPRWSRPSRSPGRRSPPSRPASVSLYAEQPSGSPRNVWLGTVTSVSPHGTPSASRSRRRCRCSPTSRPRPWPRSTSVRARRSGRRSRRRR